MRFTAIAFASLAGFPVSQVAHKGARTGEMFLSEHRETIKQI
jgi:hypothetical protein